MRLHLYLNISLSLIILLHTEENIKIFTACLFKDRHYELRQLDVKQKFITKTNRGFQLTSTNFMQPKKANEVRYIKAMGVQGIVVKIRFIMAKN